MIINRTQIKVHNDFILRFYTTHYSFACTWLQILLFVLDQITLELHVRMEDNESRGKREKCPLTNYIVSIIFSSWFLEIGPSSDHYIISIISLNHSKRISIIMLQLNTIAVNKVASVSNIKYALIKVGTSSHKIMIGDIYISNSLDSNKSSIWQVSGHSLYKPTIFQQL